MSLKQRYRKSPTGPAIVMACLGSLCAAVACATAGGFLTNFLMRKWGVDGDLGYAIVAVLIIINIGLTAFISAFTILVSWHHVVSWRIPTFAFTLCIIMVRMMGPFDIQFAPFMLGAPALVWMLSCLLLRRKQGTLSA